MEQEEYEGALDIERAWREGLVPDPLLSVSELSTHIDSENGLVRALDRVSFDVSAGETFALLGESGCGKSVTALSLMRLLPPGGFVAAGSVVLDGQDLWYRDVLAEQASERDRAAVRADIAIVLLSVANAAGLILFVSLMVKVFLR